MIKVSELVVLLVNNFLNRKRMTRIFFSIELIKFYFRNEVSLRNKQKMGQLN
jgi:hypothetical protein